jgi:hypothetical protein
LDCHDLQSGLKEYSGKYYDFRSHPELIENSLEDFLPHGHRPAIRRFYEFLRWINGDNSNLETDDSAFRPPHASDTDIFNFPLQCDGRVEIIHRDLDLNTDPTMFYQMVRSLAVFLQLERPTFSAGFFELTHSKTVFTAQPSERQMGARIGLRFIALGNSSDHAFANLLVIVDAVWEGCRGLSDAYAKRSGPRRSC